MRQKILNFLCDLSATYRIPEEAYDRVINDTTDYLMRGLPAYDIDFSKVKAAIFDRYKSKSKTFPEPYIIRDCLPYGRITSTQTCRDEGALVVITLPNEAVYSFEIAASGKSREDIKRQIILNYGNAQIKIYPKGSVLIGKEVF